jgi:BirA family biotin operon repressor/biotin-[acetyl-CoA-carboxylase] ligase
VAEGSTHPAAARDALGLFSDELEKLRRGRPPILAESVVVLASTVSTNLLARKIVLDYESDGIDLIAPILLLAREQTGGRGRHGRSWSSPAGRGVYATMLLPVGDVRQLLSLPLLVGVGLCRALGPHLPRPCRLKWPNDLLVQSPPGDPLPWRKVGGILIEAMIRPGQPVVALIGFGVNWSHREEELPPQASTVEREKGSSGSLASLTLDLIAGLERELSHLSNAAYAIDSYRSLSIHQPGERLECRIGDRRIEGTFLGFDEQGLLRLGHDGGELRLAAGEVLST